MKMKHYTRKDFDRTMGNTPPFGFFATLGIVATTVVVLLLYVMEVL